MNPEITARPERSRQDQSDRYEITLEMVLGACTYVGASGLGVDRQVAMAAGFVVAFAVRGLAMRYGWSLPAFRQSAASGPWSRE